MDLFFSQFLLQLSGGIAFSFVAFSSIAATEKAPGDIDWANDPTSAVSITYADVSDGNKVKVGNSREYRADQDDPNIANLLQDRHSTFLDHAIQKSEFGAAGVAVTQADANAYWNERFSMVDSDDNATRQHQTCYEWAFTTANGKGKYTYSLLSLGSALFGEFRNRIDTQTEEVLYDNVQAGDILYYFDIAHVTYVAEVKGKPGSCEEDNKHIPSKLKWKWLQSSIFTYTPTEIHEFDMPYNKGPDVNNTKWEDQGWSEDLDFGTVLVCYTHGDIGDIDTNIDHIQI